MFNYSSLVDKTILFICCIGIYLCQTNFSISVAIVIVTVIISGFLSYFDNEKVRISLTSGFSVLCCFTPAITIFMPLIAYDMFFNKYQYFNFLCIISLIYFSQFASIQILIVVIVMITFSILIRYRLKIQVELHKNFNKLSDEARELSIQLKKQNADLIEKQDNELYLATLNERNRIAREIHDNVGHLLSSAILQAGALITINRNGQISNHLKELNETLNLAMNSIRTSVHELYDESIDLNSQIEELIQQFSFCDVSFEYNLSSNPGKKLKYAFVSIVKEALSNVIRHSNATNLTIAFREHPAFYQLIIRDNGKVQSIGEGLGLDNMIDRVNSFNGNINIKTDNGFELFISIPK